MGTVVAVRSIGSEVLHFLTLITVVGIAVRVVGVIDCIEISERVEPSGVQKAGVVGVDTLVDNSGDNALPDRAVRVRPRRYAPHQGRPTYGPRSIWVWVFCRQSALYVPVTSQPKHLPAESTRAPCTELYYLRHDSTAIPSASRSSTVYPSLGLTKPHPIR